MIVQGNPGRGTQSSYKSPQTETIGYALDAFAAGADREGGGDPQVLVKDGSQSSAVGW